MEIVDLQLKGSKIRMAIPGGSERISSLTRDGYHEIKYLSYLDEEGIINKDTVAVDVGASIGTHTVYLSMVCKNVMAFEPYSEAYNLLVKNITMNGLTNVTARNIGIASSKSILSKEYEGPTNFGAQCWWYYGEPIEREIYERGHQLVVSNGEQIEAYSLDDVVDKADFVKIDTEGMEIEVLRGMNRIVRQCSPVIMCEVWPNRNQRHFMRWMQDNNYEKFGWGRRYKDWLIRRRCEPV